ncbi:rhodanese-related sulfurtransferase [Candidatus Peregrinibacteria bacterium]|nr:MAG: rhodanese-related sulfurtransferase [Candidatus Peregrinibacteria bacterium]
MKKLKKPHLRNIYDKATCLKQLAAENFPRVTLSFYRYVKIQHPKELRDQLFREWSALGVLGRIYLAREGINAQLSVPEHHLQAFKKNLDSHLEFAEMYLNIGLEQSESFYKLTLKVKKQIVADGLPEGSFDLSNVGNHLTPEEFNEALDKEETVVVDMRNFYESKIGRFEKALCPDSNTFKEELPLVLDALKGQEDKKVIMYCTGGIRCEKASAYLKHHGFKDVNQLRGGIITYMQHVRQKNLPVRFHGQNYVFDERIAERATNEILSNCDQCETPWDSYVNCKNAACNLLFLQCPSCAETWNGSCSLDCKAVYDLPLEERRAHYAKQKKSDYTVYVSRIRPHLKGSAKA